MGPRKTNPEETIQVRLERQLEALLNLSVASAQVLSPFEQARVALDELIGLLSAERAYLFMLGDQGLNFVTGRNREGETLSAPSGYSRTVIETVYFSREPVVIAGTEQGEALGSESVVAHDLRSIICTPLRIRDRFVGVVYLDNRLARGVFTAEDIQILNALSSHIAVAMETARAARLEVEVEAERRRRELADVLSQFTATLSSTLDAEKILGQLLETLARSVKFVRASVWLGQGELKLVAHRGYPESNHPTPVIDPRSISGMAQALETSRPVWESCLTREPGLETLAWSEPFSWMVLPLLSDRRVGGIVTLSASGAESYSEYDVEVAFTFCNQAGIALANASLFDEINRLATTDSLTGLYNRRRFFQLSEMELERAARYGRRDISAIMIDVDHFKRFNDSYGHAAGDEVLRRVARICKEQLGEDGILGRLGGEEFAVLVRADARKAQEAYAEPMRTAVEAAGVDFEGQRLNVTLSLGVASLEPDEVLDQLLSRADEALYEAKNSGRNRVRASVRV